MYVSYNEPVRATINQCWFVPISMRSFPSLINCILVLIHEISLAVAQHIFAISAIILRFHYVSTCEVIQSSIGKYFEFKNERNYSFNDVNTLWVSWILTCYHNPTWKYEINFQFHTVFQSNVNNLHTVMWIQVFPSKTNSSSNYLVSYNYSHLKRICLFTVIWFHKFLYNINTTQSSGAV